MTDDPDITAEKTRRGWQLTLRVAGEPVSGLGIVDQRVRLRKAVVRSGGIAGVWTAHDHRMKGYASRVMNAGVQFMTARGFDISILFGIPDFYHRFGFRVCFPNTTFTVRAASIQPTRAPFRVRAMRRSDLDAIIRLFNRSNTDRTGSAVRPSAWGRGWRNRGRVWYGPRIIAEIPKRGFKGIVALDGRDRIVGYVAFDAFSKACMVTEAESTDDRAFGPLLRKVRSEARRAGAETVLFHLPEDHRLGEHLRRFGCQRTTTFPANAGCMARLLDAASCLDKVVAGDVPAITVPDSGGDPGPGRGTRIPQGVLAQLLFGYRSIAEVVVSGEAVVAPRDALKLADLFSPERAYMHWGDRF